MLNNLTRLISQNLLLYPATMGALTQLRAGTSAEGTGFNGKVGHHRSLFVLQPCSL